MENISTTCEFLLQISQNHSPNRVCPPSKVSHCSSVTRIRNPRRLFIAKGKFLRVLMRRVFFNRRLIFPPIRGTSHSRSDCTCSALHCSQNVTSMCPRMAKHASYNRATCRAYHCQCTLSLLHACCCLFLSRTGTESVQSYRLCLGYKFCHALQCFRGG